jgi:hypothetical protein
VPGAPGRSRYPRRIQTDEEGRGIAPAVTAWSALARAIGDDLKGRISVAIYVVAIAVALAHPGLACALYVAVAIIWLVPDPRIETALAESGGHGPNAER